MMRSFLDVQISVPIDAEAFAAAVAEDGFLGVWEEDGLVHVYWHDECWSSTIHEKLCRELCRLGHAAPASHLEVSSVPEEDWNAKWSESVQPIRIGRRVVVRSSWATLATAADDIEFIIDPRQAFGTGHHATTQLLAAWLEDIVHGGERLLDVGTGSGLLAMIGLRLGAATALGVDCDRVAIDCAQDYARQNHMGPELTLRAVDIVELAHEHAQSYDLILANLDRRTLEAIHPILHKMSRPMGILLVSGLLRDDESEMVGMFEQEGWHCEAVRRRESWVAMKLHRHA